MKYDLIIIGAGPAGIFTALEMVRNGSKKKILMIEKKASEVEEEMRIVNGKPSSLDCLIMNLKGGRRDDVCHYHKV